MWEGGRLRARRSLASGRRTRRIRPRKSRRQPLDRRRAPHGVRAGTAAGPRRTPHPAIRSSGVANFRRDEVRSVLEFWKVNGSSN